MSNKAISDKFEFRHIRPEETDEVVAIEQICFPPNEACTEQSMKDRIVVAADMFLVAYDKEAQKIAGFFNGIATNETAFRDEFFTDAKLHNPDGKSVMLLGLDVCPEYRGAGLASAIVEEYVRRERENGRTLLVLTCLESLVEMYQKMGFHDNGLANSTWGGEAWHEMGYEL